MTAALENVGIELIECVLVLLTVRGEANFTLTELQSVCI
jgi:hypothetical protein